MPGHAAWRVRASQPAGNGLRWHGEAAFDFAVRDREIVNLAALGCTIRETGSIIGLSFQQVTKRLKACRIP